MPPIPAKYDLGQACPSRSSSLPAMGDIYLVVLMHGMDDFPIKLSASEDDAKAFVAANPIFLKPSEEGIPGEWCAGPEVMRAYDLAELDASTPIGYKICFFRNGNLVGHTLHTGKDVFRRMSGDGQEVDDGDMDLGEASLND